MSSFAEINTARFCSSVLDRYLTTANDNTIDERIYRHADAALWQLLRLFEMGVQIGYFDVEIANEWQEELADSAYAQRAGVEWQAPLQRRPGTQPHESIDGYMLVVENLFSNGELDLLAALLRAEDQNLWQGWEQAATQTLTAWLQTPERNDVIDSDMQWLLDGMFLQEAARGQVGDCLLNNQFDNFCATLDQFVRSFRPVPEQPFDSGALSAALTRADLKFPIGRTALAVTLWANSWDAVRIGRTTNYKPHDDLSENSDYARRRYELLVEWAYRTIRAEKPGRYAQQMTSLATWLLDAGNQERRAFLRRLSETILDTVEGRHAADFDIRSTTT